jgi:hypothetical protein
VTADVLPFPPQGKKCKTCGFVMVRVAGEVEQDECHCCRHNLKLPLPIEGEPCPDCAGVGSVEVPVIRPDQKATIIGYKAQTCMSCLGTGRKK